MRRALCFLSLALYLLLGSVAAFGQAVYGNIVGTVTDPAGSAIANAKVVITDTQRQTAVSTVTNEDGNFTQRGLIAGTYQLRIESSGFKAAVITVTVSVDQISRADLKMEVGEVSQVVEISAEAP
ncbi:MAG: carboxypeptidase-like regulatory domain-containing protein, partial [Acidobacteriota bacterium]